MIARHNHRLSRWDATFVIRAIDLDFADMDLRKVRNAQSSFLIGLVNDIIIIIAKCIFGFFNRLLFLSQMTHYLLYKTNRKNSTAFNITTTFLRFIKVITFGPRNIICARHDYKQESKLNF